MICPNKKCFRGRGICIKCPYILCDKFLEEQTITRKKLQQELRLSLDLPFPNLTIPFNIMAHNKALYNLTMILREIEHVIAQHRVLAHDKFFEGDDLNYHLRIEKMKTGLHHQQTIYEDMIANIHIQFWEHSFPHDLRTTFLNKQLKIRTSLYDDLHHTISLNMYCHLSYEISTYKRAIVQLNRLHHEMENSIPYNNRFSFIFHPIPIPLPIKNQKKLTKDINEMEDGIQKIETALCAMMDANTRPTITLTHTLNNVKKAEKERGKDEKKIDEKTTRHVTEEKMREGKVRGGKIIEEEVRGGKMREERGGKMREERGGKVTEEIVKEEKVREEKVREEKAREEKVREEKVREEKVREEVKEETKKKKKK